MSRHNYAPEEDRLIKTLARVGIRELMRALPHLTRNQIRGRVLRLGIGIARLPTSTNKRRGRIPIPSHAHPLVRELIYEANRQGAFWYEIADRAGVRRQTLSKWRYVANPSFVLFIAAANALGMDVRLIKQRENLAEIRAIHSSSAAEAMPNGL